MAREERSRTEGRNLQFWEWEGLENSTLQALHQQRGFCQDALRPNTSRVQKAEVGSRRGNVIV